MIEWLTDPDNGGVVGGLFTVIAALMASTAALVVGLFAYPRQKQLDRRYEIAKEQRERYIEFLRAASQWESFVGEAGAQTAKDLRSQAIEITLTGSPEIGTAAMAFATKVEHKSEEFLAKQQHFKKRLEEGGSDESDLRQAIEELSDEVAHELSESWTTLAEMMKIGLDPELGEKEKKKKFGPFSVAIMVETARDPKLREIKKQKELREIKKQKELDATLETNK